MDQNIEFSTFFNALRHDDVKIVYHDALVGEVLTQQGKRNHCRLHPDSVLDDAMILYIHDDVTSHDTLKDVLHDFEQRNVTGMIVPYSKRSEAIQAAPLSFLLSHIFSLTSTDIERILRLRQAAFDLFIKHSEFELTLSGKALTYRLLSVASLKILNSNFSICPGRLYNIGHFLELASVSLPHQAASIALAGAFPVEGVVYEGNRCFISQDLEKSIHDLNHVFKLNAGKNHLLLEDNAVVDVLSNGQSVMHHIAPFLSPKDYTVTEFSFGCNARLYDGMDFTQESILNETVEGIHIGIGFPEKIHLDFVLPQRLDSFLTV